MIKNSVLTNSRKWKHQHQPTCGRHALLAHLIGEMQRHFGDQLFVRLEYLAGVASNVLTHEERSHVDDEAPGDRLQKAAVGRDAAAVAVLFDN